MTAARTLSPVKPTDPVADAIIEEMFQAIPLGRNPYGYYRQLRDRNRIYYNSKRNMWFLTGFAEVDQVLRSPVALSQYAKRMEKMRPDWRDHPASAGLAKVLVFMDGDAHQKIRRPLMPSWTKAQMERVRPQVRALAERLVDDFIAKGGGSFYDDLGHRMAEETIYSLFGLDESTPRHLPKLLDTFLFVHDYNASAEDLRRADDAAVEMHEFWKAEYMKRVRNPGDDMLSQLAQNPAFTVEEGTTLAEALYQGGFDTTALTMTTGLWLLLTHPEALAQCRDNAAVLERLPDEVLRMANAIPMTVRVAAADITVGDHVIARDDVIGLSLIAANRDPKVYADPDRFDPTRQPGRLMTFSSGVHMCVGAFLARMELYEMYRALLTRTKRIDVVGEAGFRLRRQNIVGIQSLNLAVE